jgi:YkoY family integral membrane protein
VFLPNLITILLTLLTVTLVDGLLSVDNALVLAVVVERLPARQRVKALRYGILGAYVMRGVSILFAELLIGFWQLKLIGGAYLLWLALSNLFLPSEAGKAAASPRRISGFWATVALVEWLDFTFSLDNILATVAISRETWVVLAGVFISIVAMRLVAGIFLRWLERFPVLRTTAYLLVLFIGAKLSASALGYDLGEIETFVALAVIFFGSLVYGRLRPATPVRAPARQNLEEARH